MNPLQKTDAFEYYFLNKIGGTRQVDRYQQAASFLVVNQNLDTDTIAKLKKHIHAFNFECTFNSHHIRTNTMRPKTLAKQKLEFYMHLQSNACGYDFNEKARVISTRSRLATSTNQPEDAHLPQLPSNNPSTAHPGADHRAGLMNRELLSEIDTLRNRLKSQEQKVTDSRADYSHMTNTVAHLTHTVTHLMERLKANELKEKESKATIIRLTNNQTKHLQSNELKDATLSNLQKQYNESNREVMTLRRERADMDARIVTATQEKLMSDYRLQEMQTTLDKNEVVLNQLHEKNSKYYKFIWKYEKVHIKQDFVPGELTGLNERCLRLLGLLHTVQETDDEDEDEDDATDAGTGTSSKRTRTESTDPGSSSTRIKTEQ